MASEQENTLWLIASGVAIYLAYTGKLGSILGVGPDGNKSAAGTPPKRNTQKSGPDLIGAVGAGACIAGASAYGMPALGIAAAPVCSAAAHYIVDAASWTYHAFGGGSSKVGRASNNKDVFPNDLQECAKLGITTVDACGALWDGTKWPWQSYPHQGDVAVYPPANKPPTGKPPGW